VSKEKLQFIWLLVNHGYSLETADAIWDCYDSSEKKGVFLTDENVEVFVEDMRPEFLVFSEHF